MLKYVQKIDLLSVGLADDESLVSHYTGAYQISVGKLFNLKYEPV